VLLLSPSSHSLPSTTLPTPSPPSATRAAPSSGTRPGSALACGLGRRDVVCAAVAKRAGRGMGETRWTLARTRNSI
jgi:hypothetical protein